MFRKSTWIFPIIKNHKFLTVGFCCFVAVCLIFQYNSSKRAVKVESMLKSQCDPFASKNNHNHQLPLCPRHSQNFSNEYSEFTLYLKRESLDVVEERFAKLLKIGGFYAPTKCKARYRVCIIIPYRDREEHLPIFLKNIHPFLMKQNIEYKIIIVEQTAGRVFNKGALYNAGFIEANKMGQWNYFVFHDVDLLPMDNRNIYSCSKENPRHLTVAVDTLDFRLPYEELVGGGIVFTAKQYKRVNGYSNLFWGWGGEDDDLYNRVVNSNYTVERYPTHIAEYVMLKHNASEPNLDRFYNLYDGQNHFKGSGLSSVRYRIKKFAKKRTHTWILVNIIPDKGDVQQNKH